MKNILATTVVNGPTSDLPSDQTKRQPVGDFVFRTIYRGHVIEGKRLRFGEKTGELNMASGS